MYWSPFSPKKWWNWITVREVYKKYHQFHISSSLRSWGSDRFLHPSSLPRWNYLHLLNNDKKKHTCFNSFTALSKVPVVCFHQYYGTILIISTTLNKFKKFGNTPVGSSMNSCMASLFPAWLPPLMTLNAGTGRMTSLLPARSAMCL